MGRNEMKKKIVKYLSVVLLAVLVIVFGTGVQEYCCFRTAHIKYTRKIAFIPINSHYKDSEVSKWLADEFNITERGPYKRAMMVHTFFSSDSVIGTPPGMWLVLKSLKNHYERHPELRDQIRECITDAHLNHSGVISRQEFRKIEEGAR